MIKSMRIKFVLSEGGLPSLKGRFARSSSGPLDF